MRRPCHLVAAVLWILLPVGCARAAEEARRPPNVLVILADDLGFSDLGCYGGEIDTPHLDRLAAGGLRYTQGYNTARCWPTRSALLTGYYAQAIRRDALPGGGRGGSSILRPDWTPLLPTLLAPAGYASYHSGKWHVDRDPRRQGFARSFEYSWMNKGTEDDYFDSAGVRVDGEPLAGGQDFYLTTAIGDHAVACLRNHAADHPGRPFFQYVAFTAPHFPLHAPQALVAAYRERYRAGWDAVRAERCRRVREFGIVTTPAAAPEPDVGPPYQPNAKTLARLGPGEVDRPLAWEALTPEQQEFQATKMAIHAAMVEMMDRAVGAIVGQLEAMGALDDTLILFASDNGGSAEVMIRGKGHDPALPPGAAGTYLCLGPGWSTCANAPFRRHKTWVHEGGIATPWIVHWPRGIAARGELRTQPVHVIDVVPTVLELAGVAPPAVHDGKPVPPLQGRSFVPSLGVAAAPPVHDSLWWCHEGNRAVRQGDWKLVAARGEPWELYDLAADRCETRNLAAAEPRRVADLSQEWERIAKECSALAGPPAEFAEDPRFQEQMRRPRPPPPQPTAADVRYGAHPKQVLHFWKAPSATAEHPAPLVFYVHGGGWQGGDRLGGLAPMLTKLLDGGISVASIEYRFITDAMEEKIDPPVRAPLEDAARALQTVRSRAAEWHVDPRRIAAAGASAGGCTSLWLAFHDDLADPAAADPVARESTRVAAVAVSGAQTTLDPAQMTEWTPNSRYGGHAFGFMDTPEKRDERFADFLAARDRLLPAIGRYSPYALVSADDPPVYLSFWTPAAVGKPAGDPTHTANFGVKLKERLDAAGVPCELVYQGSGVVRHSSDLEFLIDTLRGGE